MGDFMVVYRGGYYNITSKVYAVDYQRDRFLIVDNNGGYFQWVKTDECTLYKGSDEEE